MGEQHSAETKIKISIKAKERFSKPENNPMFGKNHSKETRKKMSDNHWDCSGANNPNSKAVICKETLDVFSVAREAEEWCGKTGVNRCCRGAAKTCGGYHWMYYDEYLANEIIDNQQGSSE